MKPKFLGRFDELQRRILRSGIAGAWRDCGNQKQYRADNGAILNWWQTTGTIQFQGRESAIAEIKSAAARAIYEDAAKLPDLLSQESKPKGREQNVISLKYKELDKPKSEGRRTERPECEGYFVGNPVTETIYRLHLVTDRLTAISDFYEASDLYDEGEELMCDEPSLVHLDKALRQAMKEFSKWEYSIKPKELNHKIALANADCTQAGENQEGN